MTNDDDDWVNSVQEKKPICFFKKPNINRGGFNSRNQTYLRAVLQVALSNMVHKITC